MVRIFWLIILSLSGQSVIAAENEIVANSETVNPQWIKRHAEGWFWRELPPEEIEPAEEVEKVEPILVNPATLYPGMDSPLADPLATLASIQKAVETSKARAVLQPTPANIENWIRVQNELLSKSTLLADNWQRTVWRNPELDYTQVRPANPVALSAYSTEYKNDRRQALRDIAQEYGLYFIVAESCIYCHAMAPYLKRFADTYGFTVISVSTDGGSVAEFPNPLYSPEFVDRLGVKQTPAIILAKPNEGIIEPIAYGFISLDELEKRVYRLFRLEPGEPNYRVDQSTNLNQSLLQ